MVQKLRVLLFALLLLPFTMYGEGSKQLTPNRSTSALTSPLNDKAGYLAHDANFPSASGVSITSLGFLKPYGFTRNGSTYSTDHRLYIRVKNGERLMYGVRRAVHDQTSASQSDLIITIRRAASPSDQVGTIVQQTTLLRNRYSTRSMLLQTGQAGVITNATEVSIGPEFSLNGSTRNAGGYTPLTFINGTGSDQDYWVEFTQDGEPSWTDDGRRFSVYDLWDFTVVDANGTEKPGRLHSKLWSFSAGGTGNVFSKDFNMYPLIPSADQTGKYFVKKIELAGIAPQNFFRFVTNSKGSTAAAGSSDTHRRKSQLSQTDYPEYANFVNNPDPEIWPSAEAPEFTVKINSSCNTSTNGGKSVFSLNTSEASTFIVLINLNGVDGYQAGTADVLLESTGAKGNRTVEWNGLNGLGQVVPNNTNLNYFFRNNSAPVHFPVWDAEANADGYRVEDVRPLAGSNYNGLLFWDDTNLPTSSFPAPQTELFGVASTGGVHRWGSASSIAGDLKTVNTWTYGYTGSSTQTSLFTYDCSADVAVTNTAASAPYTIGKPFTYTVTVTNNGPIAASNIRVTDLLDPAKLQFISSSDAANYVPSTGVWTVGSLLTGASKILTITASPKVLGDIFTTATQTHTEPDKVEANNSATALINVQAAADIEVKNVSDKTTYNNGDLVTYTVTAKNLGPNPATGVVVTDKLPTGLTLAGTAPAGYDVATGNWTVGSLAVNETKTLTLVARTSALGAITTTATLGSRSGFQVDEVSSNNTASTTITVAPSADVAVTSTVSSANPGQNEEVMFTIKAANNGPNNATNVSVANQLPAGMVVTSTSASLGSFNASTGVWSVGTIASGGSQTLTVYAKAAATGSYTLTSTQTHPEFDSQSGNNSASSTIAVKSTADVAVTNTVSAPTGTTYTTGETVTYTVRVTNNGPSAATNVVVTDKLPGTLTYAHTSNKVSTGTSTYNASTGDITWTVGTLASGATATMTFTATINQSAVITTTATQTHTEYDNVSSNNSASNNIRSGTGVVTADIAVAVSTPQPAYYTKEAVPFKVVVTNNGPDAATNVTLAAALPAGFSLTSTSPATGTYSNGLWTIPYLAAGASTELLLTGTPHADTSVPGDKNYTFSASRTGTPVQVDDVSTNNSAATTLVVRKAADASLALTVTSNDPAGNYYHNLTEATFRMTVTNNGPDVITNLQGIDTRTRTLNFIPSGLVVPSGTSYNFDNGIWNVGTLAVGESKTLELKGVPNTTGRLNLGGNITGQDQFDPVSGNNQAVALLNVLPVAELAVTNTAAAATFFNGQETSFTVRVQNNGPDAATGVVIEDKLPAGLAFVSATASSGAYNPATGRWTLDSDVLPGAENAQILVIRVKPQRAATYTTTASVVATNQHDNVASNNSQTASIQGAATADIAVSSTIVSGPYYVGGQYQVSVTATNLGPDPATGVVIASGVAPGLILVTGSGTPAPGTSIDPATGLWTIGTLGVNETKTLTLLAQPTTIGVLNSLGYKYAANEYDPEGGTTKDGNNSTVIHLTAIDREATAEVLLTNRHMFLFNTGDHIAVLTDPDGPIQSAEVIGGTLPKGMRLQGNGELEVAYKHALVPGTYTLTIRTTDAVGGVSETAVSYMISGDWDNDGVADVDDLDDNNDGIITEQEVANPTGDHDGDGVYNYLDPDFVHPVYGAFKDLNHDDIHDGFDIDLDGMIRGYDIDIDGDGIPNAIEANGGVAPEGYNPLTGTFTSGVNKSGIPLAVLGADGKVKLPNPDTDGDGYKDFQDTDSDNDGILDNIEAQSTFGFTARTGSDSDHDGLDNAYDPTCGCETNGTAVAIVNTDRTDLPDYRDTNSDNDQYEDFVEALDDDQDGITLGDYKTRAAAFEAKTGKGYYTTQDSNQNGIPNWLERVNGTFAFLIPGNQYYRDTDLDGLVDLFDAEAGGAIVTQQLVLKPGTTDQYEYAARLNDLATPLPVTLLHFTAKAQANGVVLNWATAAEKDNDYFQVERSLDGKNFSAIGQVKGNGTSNVRLDYRFLDATAPAGTLYYRLKQVDTDGKHEYSKTVAVQTKAGATPAVTVRAYPNPTSEAVHLDLTAVTAPQVTVTVYALDGRLVKTLKTQGGAVQRLDLTDEAAGTYLVKIQGTGVDTVVRVVKR
ncbi:T9SS type A sorting domain-containing protein [Rufibacter psychrotolerans]|uniref:T9SS type A sorting domain-containing protein n=1 Tax=Rufibacter psychrotolerans TaxID=2812556 RepID=UPI001967D98B|nr:T9SS type A sorting domain-containing protein [Rufibacter sp. SYSU D00308]